MAITVEEICEHLQKIGLTYSPKDDDPDTVISGFGELDNYRDSDGDNHIGVFIQLLENGEYLRIFTPYCFNLEDCKHKNKVFQVLLMVSWHTKLVQFEYDIDDDEVRAIVEFPIEDGTITTEQLSRCIYGLVEIVDEYYNSIKKAIDAGIIDVTDSSSKLRKLLEVLKSPDDIDRLLALMEGHKAGDEEEEENDEIDIDLED